MRITQLALASLFAITIGCGGNVVVDGVSSRGVGGAMTVSGSGSLGNGGAVAVASGGIGGAGAGGATNDAAVTSTTVASSSSATSSSTGVGGAPTGALWDILGLPSPAGSIAPVVVMAVDANANTFFAASYNGGPVTFASEPTCAGPSNVLVAKVSPAGQLVWLKCIERPPQTDTDGSWLGATGIAVSGDGQVALTGTFNGRIVYQGATFTQTVLTGSEYDAFLLGLDASTGALRWSKQLPHQSQEGCAVAADPGGDVYFGGNVMTKLDLGSVSLTPNPSSLFLAKLDQQGNGVWITEVAHDSWSESISIAVSPGSDFAALLTVYQGSADFGDEEPRQSEMMLLAELDAVDGRIEWGIFPSKRSGGGFTTMVFTPTDDLVLSGSGAGLDLGAGPVSPKGLPFVVELDPTGAVRWQEAFSGVPQAGHGLFQLTVPALATDAGGNILALISTTASELTLGGGSLFCPAAGGTQSCLSVGRLDPLGNATFGDVVTGNGLFGGGIAFGNRHPLVAGAFSGAIDFGAGAVPSPPTGQAVFLAELP